jgi:cyanophycinase
VFYNFLETDKLMYHKKLTKIMKPISKLKYIITLLFLILFGFGCIVNTIAQQSTHQELISPINGKLMLVGSGEISARVGATFAYLSGEEEAKLVILVKPGKRDTEIPSYWQELIGNITIIKLDKADNTLAKADLEALRDASAVWLEDDFSDYASGSQLKYELKSLLRRDGTVGGQGVAAESIATLVKDGSNIRDGFNLLPNSIIQASKDGEGEFTKTLNRLPGRVGWEIPPRGAVVIHSGREISVIGDPEITLRTPANGDWPQRVASFGPPIDELPFTTDLISWNRSATARLGELFPPAEAPVPEVPNGALVIIGGHGFPEGMWDRVIEFAGGTGANYVCFAQSAGSTGAEMLRERGCKNIAVHLVRTGVDGIGQGNDARLLEDLEKADAIYFGGGRTYKFMDAYLDTEAHMLMNNVLERGGIILGGSAGAQIQGDFLVRGDPRTNNTVWMEGNDVGLGFIRGVIIDVHFRERGRENILPELLIQHPQMLGIGIDETTAIWVEGTTAEVLGPHSVTFYDQNPDVSFKKIGSPVILMKGEKYDLKLRKQIDL